MDDMTALERQIGATLDRMGGPPPAFDPMQVTQAAAASGQASPWRRLMSFDATRVVVAAALTALFGGLLLFGLLSPTTQEPAIIGTTPSPEATEAEPTTAPPTAAPPTAAPTAPSDADWTVGPSGDADFTTITAAIAAAADGDVIRIEPGTYPETVLVDKDLELLGDTEADVRATQPRVRIRPTGEVAREAEDTLPSPLTIAADAVVRGVAIEEGRTVEGGRAFRRGFFPWQVRVRSGSATLDRLVFTDLVAEDSAEADPMLTGSVADSVGGAFRSWSLTDNDIRVVQGLGFGTTGPISAPGATRLFSGNRIEELYGGLDSVLRDNTIGEAELNGDGLVIEGNTFRGLKLEGDDNRVSANRGSPPTKRATRRRCWTSWRPAASWSRPPARSSATTGYSSTRGRSPKAPSSSTATAKLPPTRAPAPSRSPAATATSRASRRPSTDRWSLMR
jgi:hypothetical protein